MKWNVYKFRARPFKNKYALILSAHTCSCPSCAHCLGLSTSLRPPHSSSSLSEHPRAHGFWIWSEQVNLKHEHIAMICHGWINARLGCMLTSSEAKVWILQRRGGEGLMWIMHVQSLRAFKLSVHNRASCHSPLLNLTLCLCLWTWREAAIWKLGGLQKTDHWKGTVPGISQITWPLLAPKNCCQGFWQS